MTPRRRRASAPRARVLGLTAITGLACAVATHASPFASRVLDYSPAPGQFVRNTAYNDPSRALGPPGGAGGTSAADNTKVVTLGGFGGSITLGFDQRIYDNPHNPRGIDLVIYGNAFWFGGDPERRWAEAGTVEVSVDVNGNGLADDPWYLIAGPAFALGAPVARAVVTWDDQIADTTYPPASANWVPLGRSGVWTSTGYLLGGPFSASILVNQGIDGAESYFGLADLSPTAVLGDTDGDDLADDAGALPEVFYTSAPDDPRRTGLSPGSGGGDGIDLAWAIDAATGLAVNLPWIDFVRITTAANAINPPLGEVSTEVSAVADVRPRPGADWNLDGTVSVQDIFGFLVDYFSAGPDREGGGGDFNVSGATTVQDIFDFLTAYFSGQ